MCPGTVVVVPGAHSETIAPLPAAVVNGVPPVQADPKPVLLVLL